MATFQPLLRPPTTFSFGAAGVGEEHLVELGRAVGLHDRPHLDAGLLHRHEQVGDARVLRRGRGRCGPAGRCSRRTGPGVVQTFWPLMTHSSPSSTALVLRPARSEPGVGLAEALAPRDLSREDLREELLLLLLGAPLQDRRADERVAEEVGPQRCAGPGELLVQHHALHGREALAAVLLRPRGADPAAVEELLRPLLVELAPLLGRHLEARRRTSLRAGSPRARLGSRRGTPRRRAGRSGPWAI